jgi:serine/threonine protein kinase
VHRDLKPANIFFHHSHSYIGDFGFAVREQNLRQFSKYNVGSPVYMPPEALNFNKYSHKSDIWAIGVIFYEMLTGTTPWTGRTETELKVKLRTIPIRNILPSSISKVSC